MSFEATKCLSGARNLVKVLEMDLDSITEYSAPAFHSIGGGGGGSSDRVSGMIQRTERIIEKYTIMTDACLYLEEAAQAELDTVDNLELKAMIHFRYLYGMSWPEIARKMSQNGERISTDAIKKRFERGIKAYEEQGIKVQYSRDAQRALDWLKAGIGRVA